METTTGLVGHLLFPALRALPLGSFHARVYFKCCIDDDLIQERAEKPRRKDRLGVHAPCERRGWRVRGWVHSAECKSTRGT